MSHDKQGWGILPLMLCFIVSLVSMTLVFLNAAVAESSSSRSWMNTDYSASKRADLLLRAMTLDEKITLLHGTGFPTPTKAYAGYVPRNPRLGIPALKLADGRAGVGNDATNATLLPAPISAAASWDLDLMKKYGEVLGAEEWAKGTNVALGPTINVIRVPEWGRAFETYGEDPLLNGEMAAAEIQGIQSQGPIADANMYLMMSQETNRFGQNMKVDERTLQEIYLPPFQSAVQQGHVGTFMCAYIKTNGVYSCQNRHLLTDILRKQLGFRGWVMSDWWATHSTVASAETGLDQEMPDAKYYGQALKTAVEQGKVSMATLNRQVDRILVTMFRHGLFDKPQPGNWTSDASTPGHVLFSRTAAEQGTVLLKNAHSLLPLKDVGSIAVFGADGGQQPIAEGKGSSDVIAPRVVSPLDGIRRRADRQVQVSYSVGTDLAAAAKAAQSAKVAIVFAGVVESEGVDRPDLRLPGDQDQLIAAVARANPNTVVVLNTGGAVLMPWINQVSAVVEAWYPGQEDGNAIAAILFGDVNPSGKLPVTFPRTQDEVPTGSAQQWPGGNTTSQGFAAIPVRPARSPRVPGVKATSVYSEKLNVGYRWYDAHHVKPLFPFGYGLSYTAFRMNGLVVTPKRLTTRSGQLAQNVQVRVTVTNIGHRTGAEVVEAYVVQPAKNGEPPLQLRGFEKVILEPGQSKQVTLALQPRSFSIFDTKMDRWVTPTGVYGVLVGNSSRNLPLHADVTISGR